MIARRLRNLVFCLVGTWIACAARGWAAAQALPAPLLNDLKGCTVYVKVNRRTLDWSGSGFVIQKKKGGPALIVTNAHVLQFPKIDDTDISKKISKENMKRILELQKEVSGVPSTANVVFFSGTPQEVTLPAEIVAEDVAHDLAVLKVDGVPDNVKPIKPNNEKIPETTQLIGLGFPFGGLLAAANTNPTITVLHVELTSYKPITNDLTLLQLQGAMNHGNSGGPIVDAQGKLCGVLVSGFPGTGLSFAIPTELVVRMVRGRLSTWRLALKKSGEGQYDVEYRVQLVDPMKKINGVDLHYLIGAVPIPSLPEFKAAPKPLGGAKSVELKRDGQWAVANFKVQFSGAGPLVMTLQPTWTDGSKKKQLGRPTIARISLGTQTPVGSDDGRTFWRYVDKKKGEGWFVQTATGWDEEDDGATHHFLEVKRDPDLIEVYDARRKLRVHLHHDKLAFLLGKSKKWIILYQGGWEATGVVVAPD